MAAPSQPPPRVFSELPPVCPLLTQNPQPWVAPHTQGPHLRSVTSTRTRFPTKIGKSKVLESSAGRGTLQSTPASLGSIAYCCLHSRSEIPRPGGEPGVTQPLHIHRPHWVAGCQRVLNRAPRDFPKSPAPCPHGPAACSLSSPTPPSQSSPVPSSDLLWSFAYLFLPFLFQKGFRAAAFYCEAKGTRWHPVANTNTPSKCELP